MDNCCGLGLKFVSLQHEKDTDDRDAAADGGEIPKVGEVAVGGGAGRREVDV